MNENASTHRIPRDDWSEFLGTFSRSHRGWPAQLETYDLVTGEKVASREMPLESIEFDLEDEKNPRINVTLQLENKHFKHILFLPSHLVAESSSDGRVQSFHVETLNTQTTLRLRKP